MVSLYGSVWQFCLRKCDHSKPKQMCRYCIDTGKAATEDALARCPQPRYKCFQWAGYLFWWLRRLVWCDQPARHLLALTATAVWGNKLVLHWKWKRKCWRFRSSAENLPGFPQKLVLGYCAKTYFAAFVSLWDLSRQHKDVGTCCQGASALLCKHIPNVSWDAWL